MSGLPGSPRRRALAVFVPVLALLVLWGCANAPRGPYANERAPAPMQSCQEVRGELHPASLEEVVDPAPVMAWFEARRGAPMDGPLAFTLRLPMEAAEEAAEEASEEEAAEEAEQTAEEAAAAAERAERARAANPPMEALALSGGGFSEAEVAELEAMLEAARRVRPRDSGLPGRVRVVFAPADGEGVARGADEDPVEVFLQPSVQCLPVLLGREQLVEGIRELRAGSIDDREVTLSLFVARNGRVESVVAPELEAPLQELPGLIELAEELRFHPALLDGQLRGMWVNQPFNLHASVPGLRGTNNPYR